MFGSRLWPLIAVAMRHRRCRCCHGSAAHGSACHESPRIMLCGRAAMAMGIGIAAVSTVTVSRRAADRQRGREDGAIARLHARDRAREPRSRARRSRPDSGQREGLQESNCPAALLRVVRVLGGGDLMELDGRVRG